IPVGLVIVAAVLVTLVARMPEDPEPTPAGEASSVNVKVLSIRPIPKLADTLTLSAVVEPHCVVRVAAEVAGRIERLGRRQRAVTWRGREIAAGQVVEEGEPIARGDPIIYLNKELLQARYERARAQCAYDKLEYERIDDLYQRDVTSKTEFDDAKMKYEVSKATLDEATRNLERAEIVAPISGILNRLSMELGEYASSGDQVAEIVDIDKVKVVVDMPERDVYYLHVGDTTEIFVRVPQETKLTGEIAYISELADVGARTTRLEITVDNRGHVLRSGQIVRARLTRRVLTDVIMIPLGSVIPLERGRVVYVVNEDHAERRVVELGLIKGHSVQVLSGVQAGDRLIVAGHRYVGPGQPVTIVSETAAPAIDRDVAADVATGRSNQTVTEDLP
ncbi:MAG: efflux RND transporter periplasmic adaptor subunit, partial [Phycisphaerae bacterium]